MAPLVYCLCASSALACTVLLLRAYRRSGVKLLLWSGICFGFLTASNGLISIDLIVFPETSLFATRNLMTLTGLSFLLWGLIGDAR